MVANLRSWSAALLRLLFASCGVLAAGVSTYDLLVIGGGSAGIGAAKYAAKFGKRVALIEKDRLGGDCTWTGCVPSKTLLASAKRAHAARTASSFGVSTGEVTVDMRAIKARIDSVVQRIYEEDDSPAAFANMGVDTISGMARFVDRSTLSVVGSDGIEAVLRARDGILIATGARPRPPTISGLDRVRYLTYENVFELEEVPSRLTVVGGGPIGCECPPNTSNPPEHLPSVPCIRVQCIGVRCTMVTASTGLGDWLLTSRVLIAGLRRLFHAWVQA